MGFLCNNAFIKGLTPHFSESNLLVWIPIKSNLLIEHSEVGTTGRTVTLGCVLEIKHGQKQTKKVCIKSAENMGQTLQQLTVWGRFDGGKSLGKIEKTKKSDYFGNKIPIPPELQPHFMTPRSFWSADLKNYQEKKILQWVKACWEKSQCGKGVVRMFGALNAVSSTNSRSCAVIHDCWTAPDSIFISWTGFQIAGKLITLGPWSRMCLDIFKTDWIGSLSVRQSIIHHLILTDHRCVICEYPPLHTGFYWNKAVF